jgi:hypothetical protein
MSDRLTAKQVAILKAADARGVLLPDADMRSLFKHIEALEADLERLHKFLNIVEEFAEHDDPSVKYAMREALEGTEL